MTPTSPTLDAVLRQHAIEQLLFHEARLIDSRRFDEWMDLFADDLHYWMPVRSVRAIKERGRSLSGPGDIAHFDETKALLRQRTDRLTTGMAWSDDPASQTRHLITNVIVEGTDVEGEFEVHSSFHVHQQRMERDVDEFVGARLDLVRQSREHPLGYQIARRHIALDQTVILAKAITTFF